MALNSPALDSVRRLLAHLSVACFDTVFEQIMSVDRATAAGAEGNKVSKHF